MRYAYAKMTFHMMFISFLAFIFMGCGESGTPGGASGPGVTASISINSEAATLPADGVSSTPITAVLTDSVGAPVNQQTSVVFRTNLGTFRNGAKEYKTNTADDTGRIIVQLTTEETPGNAEVWAESNKVKQKIEVKFFDPHKVGTISLRTGSSSITADGSSQVAVIATVNDALGNPEAGAEVNFKTTLGQFYEENPLFPGILNRNTTAITDVDGEAVVMLISGKTIGTATILASLDGLNTTTNVVFTAGEPDTISLRAAPSTIRPNGTTNLFAKLRDINGNPVEGKTIIFSEFINASGGTLNSLSNTTNVNGEAQVTYTAGKDPGADIIQAAMSSDLGMKATTTIVVDPGAIVIGGITVTAGSPSLVADGKGKVKIRALVTDIDGNVASGKTVNFVTTAGTLSSASATTSELGLAEVTLQATTISGPATVTADCDGFIGDASVEFIPGPADHILMYALPNIVPPNGEFKTSAIIMDKYNNRIFDQRLAFQIRIAGNADVINSAELTADQAEDGVFSYTWIAASVLYGLNDIEITAKVNNGVSKAVVVQIDEDAIIVGSISVIAGATAIEANGVDSTTVRATVLDSNGQPAQGVNVKFATTLGSLSASQKKTDQNGIAEVKLQSGTTWGTATVTADANGFKGQVKVLLTSGKAGGVSLTALPSTVLPGGQSTIIAEINNGSGAPVEGETLYFDLYDNNTNSALSSVNGVSDVNGRATVTYTAGIIEGVDRIRVRAASDSSITDTTSVTVRTPTGTVGSITLASGAATLPADGISSTTVTASVFDTTGTPMPKGTEIIFTTTAGTFPGGADPDGLGPITSQRTFSTSDESGTVITSLIAGTVGGVAQIKAAVGDVSQMLNIIINDGSVAVGSVVLTSAEPSIPADGKSSTAITAVVKDTAGNSVPAGTPVVLTTSIGTFAGGLQSISLETSGTTGTVTTSLISGLDEGVAFVSATAGNITQSIQVIFEEGGSIGTAEMLIDVSKRVIDATGSSRSEIKALLRDENHNPIQGATVNFSTSLGTVTGSAITGTDGYAYVNGQEGDYPVLISAKQNGVATVKSWYGPRNAPYATAETNVEFSGVTITVTADPDSLSTSEQTTIEATLRGPAGETLADQDIILETDLGVFSVISAGTVTNGTRFTAKTDISGKVSVKLSSTSGGTATVTGWHGPTKGMPGETSDTQKVIFSGKKLTMTPEEDWLVADGVDSMIVLLTLEDESGSPVAGQIIALATTLGNIDNFVTTNADGEVYATLTAGTVIGTATLTANVDLAGGAKITAKTEVPFISGPVASIELVADPSIIKINTGVSEIRALVRDPSGNPVHGVNVAFKIIHAPGGGETITPAIAQTGDTQSGYPGQVVASFKAGSLGSSHINDVIIEASVGNISAATSLTITSNATNIALGACTTKECITDNGDGSYSIPISAVISDVNGIAVPAGVEVAFAVDNADLGIILSPVSTDDNGRAATTLTYPATKAGGVIKVIATTSGVSESVTIELPGMDSGAISNIFLTSPASILGDGVSKAELRAQAVDKSGNTVEVSVFFDSSVTIDFTGGEAGNFVDYLYYLGGETRTNFVADPGADENADPSDGFVSLDHDAFLKAYSGTIVSSAANKILVKGITLTVEPAKTVLLANGTSTTTVTATLKETTTGLPISEAILNFGVTSGLISGANFGAQYKTDASGVVLATFTSIKSDVDKTASIRCYYGPDIMASTEIELITSATVAQILASSDKTTIYNTPDQTATITAQVLAPGGNPVEDGQTVNFEIISGPGQVSASSTTTNGKATATFTATPEIGTSRIRISSGGLETILEIEIVEKPIAIQSITVIPGASAIPANGTSTTVIRATVLNTDGNPATDIFVNFGTTLGTLVGATTVKTNANGIAEVTLQSATSTGTAIVTAEAAGFISSATVTFTAGVPNGIVVNAAPGTVNPKGTSTLTATLTDAGGNPLAGETITFSFTDNNSGASLSAPSAVTDIIGQASITYTAGATETLPGDPDEITARSVTNSLITGIANINVDASATVVGGVMVTSGAASIPANGTSTTAIRATVVDTDGNPMSGFTVNFATTLGTLSSASAVTNGSGIAQVTLTSAPNTGIATVTANAGGFISSANVTFTAGVPNGIVVNAAPSTVNPKGTSTVTATLTDASGNPLSGETIRFTFAANNSGATLSAPSAVTNINGQAVITYTAGETETVTPDQVRATSVTNSLVTGTANIIVDADAVIVGGVTVVPGALTLVANGTSTTAIRATVVDTDGSPMSGFTVNFATTLGTLSAASAVTNGSGIAQVTLTSAANTGTAKITANAGGFIASANVTFTAGVPGTMLVNAAPSTVNPEGTSTVTATLTDASGNPLSGETIRFTFAANNSGATLSAPSAVTNINGQAVITYTAGETETVTPDQVRAASVTNSIVTGTANIIVDADAVIVGGVTVTSGAASISANGTSTTAIRATVVDTDGNPMSGFTVNFATTLGTLSAASDDTDGSGIAQVTLTSAPNTG
ncbi:MAG: invasin domain 3-containing protein, partial [Desulfosalsimonadaceae bacterium]